MCELFQPTCVKYMRPTVAFPFFFFSISHAAIVFDLYAPQWKDICALKVLSFYNLFSQMLIKTAFVCLGLRMAQLAFYEIGSKKVLPPQRM